MHLSEPFFSGYTGQVHRGSLDVLHRSGDLPERGIMANLHRLVWDVLMNWLAYLVQDYYQEPDSKFLN